MNTRPRILVIDDDPLFRNLMMTILGKEFHVVVASEGSEGFHIAIESPPDVAIIDLQMPGWDGMRTLKAVKSHPALSQVKVMILTAIATRKMVLEAIQGGANDYVVKTSFRREEFLAKLLRLLPDFKPHEADVAPAHYAHADRPMPFESAAIRPAANVVRPGSGAIGKPPMHAPTTKPVAATSSELVGAAPSPATSATADAALRAIIDHWE